MGIISKRFDTACSPEYNAPEFPRRIRLVDQDAALSRRRSRVRIPYAANDSARWFGPTAGLLIFNLRFAFVKLVEVQCCSFSNVR